MYDLFVEFLDSVRKYMGIKDEEEAPIKLIIQGLPMITQCPRPATLHYTFELELSEPAKKRLDQIIYKS